MENLEDAKYGFVTYKNYLLGLSYLLDLIYSDYAEVVSKVKNVQPKVQSNQQKVRNLLFNSWNSELLLNFPKLLKIDFLKFSNHWSPVQSYYSIYLALRALIVAKNIDAKGDHTTTLQVTASNFVQNEKLFPLPWGVLYETRGFRNLPQAFSPEYINPLENPYHFSDEEKKLWDCFCLFLKTTRDRLIEERCREWKSTHPTKKGTSRKRLPTGQKSKIAQKVRAVSIFDCFYRLRIRSNYKDVDIFILGSSSPETEYYFDALCNITDKTLFLIENYIDRYLGRNKLKQLVYKYKEADTLGINERLKFNPIKRCQYYG